MARRVGLVGYGTAGRVFHAPLIASTPGLELAVVVTSDPGRVAAARRAHPSAVVTSSLDDALGTVELLVVASPNDSHVALARRAVSAGVDVVVDKPLAATAEEGRALVEEAGAGGVGLTVFHNRRWDGDWQTLRTVVDGGTLGRVHRLESRFERWRPAPKSGAWREDPDPALAGGTLFDLGSHLVDQAIALMGPVASVYAEVDRRRAGVAVDDDVMVALTHRSGQRSTLWAGALVAQAGPRLRVLGDGGGFTCWGMDPQEAQLGAGMVPGDDGWGLDASRVATVGVDGDTVEVPILAGGYEDFYASLAGGGVPVDPAEAVEVVRVLEAARRSSGTGSVVAL